MLTVIFRVGGYELSGRESTGDIDAVVMPPKQEPAVEKEILDIAMDLNLGIGQVPPSRRATSQCGVSRKACRSPDPF